MVFGSLTTVLIIILNPGQTWSLSVYGEIIFFQLPDYGPDSAHCSIQKFRNLKQSTIHLIVLLLACLFFRYLRYCLDLSHNIVMSLYVCSDTFGYFFPDNEEIASTLEELYGDIDALEFYPGLLLEKTRPGAIFGQSMVEMGAPFSLKGLLGNPICSPEYWKPSTFGGKVGFDIVNSATLKKLVCLNSRTCPYVAFRVPAEEKPDRNDGRERSNEL